MQYTLLVTDAASSSSCSSPEEALNVFLQTHYERNWSKVGIKKLMKNLVSPAYLATVIKLDTTPYLAVVYHKTTCTNSY